MAELPRGVNADKVADEVRAHYQRLSDKWTGLRQRQVDIRNLVEDRWWEIFGDDVSPQDLPLIANFFRDHIEDIGRLFAKIGPMTRVFPKDAGDEDGAERRERVFSHYHERSHSAMQRVYHGQDYPAAGYTAVKVWPEKGYRGAERFPVFRRLDPLKVLPDEYRPEQPTEYAAVCETRLITDLQREYPDEMKGLLTRIKQEIDAKEHGYDLVMLQKVRDEMAPTELTVVDWHSCNYIAKVAVYASERQTEAVLLHYLDNPTGLCPVQISYRPTWASEPKGLLDDAKGPVRMRNRYWHMLVDYFVQMVYGGKLVWNVSNPTARGPNQTYMALGPDAFMKPVTPDSPALAALQVLTGLEAEGREGAVKPSAREGEVNLNKATAAFLSRSQGKLSDVVQELHDRWAITTQYANVIAMEQDKAWCQGQDKRIFGIARGKRFEEKYDSPGDLEDTQNWVSYGPASGLDLPTHSVLVQNKVALGLLSIEDAIEQDPTVDEPALAISRLRAQEFERAFLAQLAAEGGLEGAGEAWLAFQEGEKLEQVVQRALRARRQAAAQQILPPLAGGGGGEPGAPNPSAALGAPEAESPAVPLPPQELLRSAGRR